MGHGKNATICLILSLALGACAKQSADAAAGASSVPVQAIPVTAQSVQSVFPNMICTESPGYTMCGTDAGITQTKPSICSTEIPIDSGSPGHTGTVGVPFAIGSRTTGSSYVSVSDIWDCGVVNGQRCVLIDYANGYQDARCDIYELP